MKWTPARCMLSVAGASSGAGRKGNQMGRSGGCEFGSE